MGKPRTAVKERKAKRVEQSVSGDVLDQAGTIRLGDRVEDVIDLNATGGSSLHRWPNSEGAGWERTMYRSNDPEVPSRDVGEVIRRLKSAGAEQNIRLSCTKCQEPTQAVFHDEGNIHLVEFRCTNCGASFWPHNSGGTMERKAS